MKYILLQIFITFLGAMFLLFLFQQESFLPFDENQNFNWYNIFSVLFFLFLVVQGLVSIILYTLQKLLTCGVKEFPYYNYSLKWGIISSTLLMFAIILNIYSIIDLAWGLLAMGMILLILLLLKF